MDSENDASKQLVENPGCSRVHFYLRASVMILFVWVRFGTTGAASELAAAMGFDHIDDDLLDGCGFDGNVLIPANKVWGVAECRFAQPKYETEVDKARRVHTKDQRRHCLFA